MRHLIFTIMVFVLFNCKNNSEIHIEHINGYWEIKSVTFPNGETKEYTFNGTIDFIELKDSLNGIRKKLKPSLNGKFSTSKDVEAFKLIKENDSLKAYYKTSFANWKETILLLDSLQLKVINEDKKVYLYKRFKPLKLN